MSLSRPIKIEVPFATDGVKNIIPIPDASPLASWDKGFPPVTMQPLSAGGVPPAGQDFNGVLYSMSAILAWLNAGGKFVYDSEFATAIEGYDKGMVIQSDDGCSEYIALVNGVTSNPNVAANVYPLGTDWAPYAGAIGGDGKLTTDTGAADAYVVAPSPNDATNHYGMQVVFKAAHTNTGASTLNAGGGVAPIKRNDGSALSAGDIVANAYYAVVFDGTNWVMISPVSSQSAVPSGSVMPFAGAAAPAGYLLCDGTSYSAATYAALYAVIGHTYGGSGGNFNVPNMTGRFPIGAETGTYPLADTGGNAETTLTGAQIADHTHPLFGASDVDYATGTPAGPGDIVARGADPGGGGWNQAYKMMKDGVSTVPTIGVSGPASITPDPVPILNPYLALNYIIKT